MAEYIEREALLYEMENIKPINWTNSKAEQQADIEYGCYRELVEEQPAADVAEVVHGEWVYKEEKEGCFCSVCDIEALIDPNFIGRDFAMEELSDYCPHCGAKMDGGSDET